MTSTWNRIMPFKLCAVWAMLCCAFAANVAGGDWETSAYLKEFFSVTDTDQAFAVMGDDSAWLVDNVLRGRVKLRSSRGRLGEFLLEYEVSMIAGDSVALPTLPIVPGIVARPRFLDLESVADERGEFLLQHGLDRLAWRVGGDRIRLTIGRQSVSWGTGFFWSPSDVFAAFSPTEIERDEKPGVDVVRLEVTIAEETALDFVFEPLDMERTYHMDTDDSTWMVRASTHLGEQDVAVCAGEVGPDTVVGAELSGYLQNAGIRADCLHTWVAEPGGDDFLRALVGVDYGFNMRWQPSVAVEYYYNGFGARTFDEYVGVLLQPSVQRMFLRGTAFNVGRNYLGMHASVMPSALLTLQNQVAINLDDGSFREYLALGWSVKDNLDLLFGANVGIGGARSELGQGDIYFSYLKIYF